jgi:hypothetical protein
MLVDFTGKNSVFLSNKILNFPIAAIFTAYECLAQYSSSFYHKGIALVYAGNAYCCSIL